MWQVRMKYNKGVPVHVFVPNHHSTEDAGNQAKNLSDTRISVPILKKTQVFFLWQLYTIEGTLGGPYLQINYNNSVFAFGNVSMCLK